MTYVAYKRKRNESVLISMAWRSWPWRYPAIRRISVISSFISTMANVAYGVLWRNVTMCLYNDMAGVT